MSITDHLPNVADALRLLFPACCPSCKMEASSTATNDSLPSVWLDDGWCHNCRQQIDSEHSDRCQQCAAVLAQPSPYSRGCASCFQNDFPFELAVSVHNYHGLLQHLVIQAKNTQDDTLMAQLARLLARQVKQHAQTAESESTGADSIPLEASVFH